MPEIGDGVPSKQSSTTSAVEAEYVEQMRPAIAVDHGDAHLRHDLRQAEVEGMKHVGFALFRIEIARRLQRQPGADSARSVAEEDRRVVQVAAIARFDRQAGKGANPGIHSARDAPLP